MSDITQPITLTMYPSKLINTLPQQHFFQTKKITLANFAQKV